jgi:hypothetical protein
VAGSDGGIYVPRVSLIVKIAEEREVRKHKQKRLDGANHQTFSIR